MKILLGESQFVFPDLCVSRSKLLREQRSGSSDSGKEVPIPISEEACNAWMEFENTPPPLGAFRTDGTAKSEASDQASHTGVGTKRARASADASLGRAAMPRPCEQLAPCQMGVGLQLHGGLWQHCGALQVRLSPPARR